MAKKRNGLKLSDMIIVFLAMIILVFVVSMIAGISRYIGQGLFRAIELAWTDIADWVLGIDSYKADVEVPIVNCHISLVSYMR